ncbi:sugar permease [Lactobacillus sp. CBA3606]|uniref:PTS sugar transporter subunit IIA n=1 Tax=Lactobacillus sp. CBA3606 TaxID=2099789 RepID=UPI000CFAFA00|nr:PTS glucose transporter subunit IIA [Lactobacillus sp. CBA3606]AVK64175.1 sugar permease [Lactobacillus sp. CBA3606]
MFKFLKKKVALKLVAPVDGQIVALENVNDPVFSQKLMGEGFGIQPTSGQVYAPISGTITSVFKTKHAIGLTTPEGLEILIHIGLDTVELNGVPFSIQVKKDDQVTPKTVLADVDFEQIKAAGKETVVLTLVTNSATQLAELTAISTQPIKHGAEVTSLTLK